MEDLVIALHDHIRWSVQDRMMSTEELHQSFPEVDRFARLTPDKCHACHTSFLGREDYLSRTTPNPGIVESGNQIIEYRSCQCGEPLIMVTSCKREHSVFGMECRAYFNVCVERLIEEFQFTRDDATHLTRIIFQQVFESTVQSVA